MNEQGTESIARLLRHHVFSHPLGDGAERCQEMRHHEVKDDGRLFPCKISSGVIALISKRLPFFMGTNQVTSNSIRYW